MRVIRSGILTLFCLLILAAPSRLVTASALFNPDIPPGFTPVLSAEGVQLYRKDYPGGSPDFVEVVDLSKGAGIQLLHGDVRESRPGKGVFGGEDARFTYRSLKNYWQELSGEGDNAFCVSNGQFFYMPENPTRLPFSLKVDGSILSDGYGVNDHPGQQSMLEIWPDHMDIRELNKDNLYTSTAPNIVAGLEEDANKQAKHYVGRTFVGIADYNQDGFAEIFLLLNTKVARQVDAAAVLRSFAAEKIMMLDGGGSTQLICQNQWFVYSERLIPQAIGVFSAGDAPAQADPATQIAQTGQAADPPAQPAIAAAAEPNSASAGEVGPETLAIQEPLTSTNPDSGTAAGVEQLNFPPASLTVPETGSNSGQPAQEPLTASPETQNLTVVQHAPLVLNAKSGEQSQPESNLSGDAASSPPLGTSPQYTPPQGNFSASPPPSAIGLNSSVSGPQSSGGVDLGDIVWVPITMSPVAALLFFVIGKIRHDMEPDFPWMEDDPL